MRVKDFLEILGVDFYTGVPDSQLKAVCDYLLEKYGEAPQHHIIAANEGNCTAIAAGYYLATGRVPVVYMQNSGEGNIVNPVLSLLSEQVYGIPCIFLIGWRGEPGMHDEPQHFFQGQVTLKLLETMDIKYFVLDQNTMLEDVRKILLEFKPLLEAGKQIAFVVRKNALTVEQQRTYNNNYLLRREDIIRQVVSAAGNDIIVSTTGKSSRELFEIREANGEGHERDFLTVGSMGHSSSIALGIALQKKDCRVWCIDGDGAALMHMGAIAVIGAKRPNNFIHVIINNEAHESVGGQPTVAHSVDFCAIAKACGYSKAMQCHTDKELKSALQVISHSDIGAVMLEIKACIGARKNLGRPTTTPCENKLAFMNAVLKK